MKVNSKTRTGMVDQRGGRARLVDGILLGYTMGWGGIDCNGQEHENLDREVREENPQRARRFRFDEAAIFSQVLPCFENLIL